MRTLAAGLLALVLLTGVACSSDNEETSGTTTTTLRVLAADEIDASRSPYCAVWKRIRAVPPPAVTGDPGNDTSVRKTYYTELQPLAEELVEKARAEIRADARRALEQVQEVARTGSGAPFTAPGAPELAKRLADYALDNCAK